LLLNGEKMAKRTGNFVTLADGCVRYSADAMRFALANSGDGMDDPNFTVENVDTAILETHTFFTFVKEMMDNRKLMENETMGFGEKVFEAEMDRLIALADADYARLGFRDALSHAFFQMCNARDTYIKRYPDYKGLNWKCIDRFIRAVVIMMSPVTSHTSEHIWRELLGEPKSVFDAGWPAVGTPDLVILEANAYITRMIGNARASQQKWVQKAKKPASTMRVYVAASFPDWHQLTLKTCEAYHQKHNTLDDVSKEITLRTFLLEVPELKAQTKKVMDVMSQTRKNFAAEGIEAFRVALVFDEKAVLIENIPFLCSQVSSSFLDPPPPLSLPSS